MNKDKISTYIELRKELWTLAREIYRYIEENNKNILDFKECLFSTFTVSKDYFTILYQDERDPYNETSEIDIPIEYICNNTWKEYLS